MAKSVINLDIVNCVLLVVILIIVIVCCMKKEHFAESGVPNCNSSNPCSNYTKKTPEHSACSERKWRVCSAKKGSNFCNARMAQAEKSKRPMKVCDASGKGWKMFFPINSNNQRMNPNVPPMNPNVPRMNPNMNPNVPPMNPNVPLPTN